MTHEIDPHRQPDAPLPDELRWQLRGLRTDLPPSRDLWPGIAGRLAPREAATAPAPAQRRWLAPLALAASLLLVATTLGWYLPPTGDAPAGGAGVATTAAPATPSPRATDPAWAYQREVAGLTRQYQAAFNALGAVPGDPSLQPAINDLDRNADMILDALAQQPDSRLLLDQLRRTYAQRLALSQRMLNS
ncbi:hypothetical protein [Marilutibacter aestuarii]|uniref:DUF3379 domain-containing protein n=1 Tax=Marilutibacter aestuarii TaxID=1706195 RepID=A0A508ABJ0_9GAMM|nr:hypothetical protein [Lysobacter aestuarii]TQD44395.1 hypothetical protein FKV25_09745 [Lysobacter aestuarii]